MHDTVIVLMFNCFIVFIPDLNLPEWYLVDRLVFSACLCYTHLFYDGCELKYIPFQVLIFFSTFINLRFFWIFHLFRSKVLTSKPFSTLICDAWVWKVMLQLIPIVALRMALSVVFLGSWLQFNWALRVL